MRRRTTSTAARRVGLLVLPLVAALVLGGAPAQAVDVAVDPADLPQGSAPAIPYLDRSSRTIVDGSRRVSLAGLVGSPLWFMKVRGGYLLDRGRDDVVLVSTSGKRRVLSGRHPSSWSGVPTVAVSRGGDKVALSLADSRSDGSTAYRETRVLDIATGTVLARRVFTTRAGRTPVAFGTGRVLLGGAWWSFRSNDAERSGRSVASAHLPSWRAFGYDPATRVTGTFGLSFADVPTALDPADGRRVFSLDGSRIGGSGTTDETSGATDRIVVHDARDGSVDLQVTGVDAVPVVTWESADTVLFLARAADGGSDALVRCTVAGDCERAGPLEDGDVEGPSRSSYDQLVVTRREG